MKIAIDLDDTLSVVDRITRTNGYIARKGLPFRVVDEHAHSLVDVYDWEYSDVLEYIHDGGITIYTDAEARQGAAETLAALRAAGHEVVILTARGKDWFVNPEKVSRDWLEKRHIPYDEIVIADKKGEWCSKNGIDILVDDKIENCLDAQGHGIKAVLFVGHNNIDRAREITYGGANWAQIGAAIRHIVSTSKQE